MPTLTYGSEMTQKKNLDIEGRKGLKFLFNLSQYCKNYLHTVFKIFLISVIINNIKKCVFWIKNVIVHTPEIKEVNKLEKMPKASVQEPSGV